MGWIYLFAAGFFELGFSTFLKLSEGFTKPQWVVAFLVSASASFYLLTRALHTIPLGTAYAIWTGLGAFGTAVIGIIFFKEPANLPRILLLLLLVGSVIGLKFVTPEH